MLKNQKLLYAFVVGFVIFISPKITSANNSTRSDSIPGVPVVVTFGVSGQTLHGRVLRIKDNSLFLKKSNGKLVVVPLEQISAASIEKKAKVKKYLVGTLIGSVALWIIGFITGPTKFIFSVISAEEKATLMAVGGLSVGLSTTLLINTVLPVDMDLPVRKTTVAQKKDLFKKVLSHSYTYPYPLGLSLKGMLINLPGYGWLPGFDFNFRYYLRPRAFFELVYFRTQFSKTRFSHYTAVDNIYEHTEVSVWEKKQLRFIATQVGVRYGYQKSVIWFFTWGIGFLKTIVNKHDEEERTIYDYPEPGDVNTSFYALQLNETRYKLGINVAGGSHIQILQWLKLEIQAGGIFSNRFYPMLQVGLQIHP